MSLEDELKDLQEQLAAAEENPQEEEEKPQAPEKVDPPAPAPETDAPAGTDADKDDEPKDASAYARMRREAAQAKREAEEAKREAEALRAQMVRPEPVAPTHAAPQTDGAPDPKEDYTGWLEHQISSIRGELDRRTQNEQADYMMRGSLGVIEADAEKIRAERPDLDDAREFAVKELKKSYRLAGVPANQVDYQVNLRLIQEAAEGKKSGQNTASYLYDWAVSELGYNPKEVKAGDPPVARDLRPDMNKVAANRARNAGTMTPSGSGGGSNSLDAETLSNMKPSELQKIPLEERNRIWREAGVIS